MKSAEGKRPPHEAHGPRKEAIRPRHVAVVAGCREWELSRVVASSSCRGLSRNFCWTSRVVAGVFSQVKRGRERRRRLGRIGYG